ncbi:MAG TPA: amino acid adenylation domain-containing protein, partial [Chitinophagaceae bacterium]|nr:amino acid adenylation domain-containing protein [Chitinophagaceae bacterium]
VDLHHIIADGVSQTVLVSELAAFYRGESLPGLRIQYKDYAEWQQSQSFTGNFWKEQLANAPVLELPADHARPSVKNYSGSTLQASINTRGLNQLARQEDTTLFMVLLAAYNIMLSKLSSQEDIVIGVPVAGRQHADLEHIIGMLVNTIALRNFPKGETSFKEFLDDVKNRALACFENQSYPYETLIDELKVTRDAGRNPLFDVMFMFHNFETAQPDMPGLTVTPYHWHPPISKFDLTLIAKEIGDELLITVEYSTEIFEAATVKRFIEYFKNIVSVITIDVNVRLADIGMLPESEREWLLRDDTYLELPENETIVSLFEEQVQRTPDAIAVISGDDQLSYAELNKRADAIAAYLGDCTGSLIGLKLERDINLLPSILGVLRSGAGYVPIDPTYPEERIRYVIEDSGIKQLLTTELVKNIPPSTPEKVEIDANAPAYMIYTSGSTGKPKGVVITHRNVINFIYGTRKAIDFSAGSRMLSVTTISFDIFVLETLLPLLGGMTVVLAGSNEQKSLIELIKKEKVDFIQMTPSHVKLLHGTDAFNNIKVLMIGGEALPPELVTRKVYNMYGPTETTVWSCIAEVQPGEPVTIGKPIANTVIRILDKHGKLVPAGVAGEICIGGEGVSPGYWKRPELTAEKFVSGLYHTGDLGKWRADGQLICLGRIDQQVKVRGHRIEPGEIEAQLNTHAAIIRSAVDVKGQGSDKYLVAYYEAYEEIDPAILRAHLSGTLPAYMVPTVFMKLGKLPLTPNGKLERKALPDPQVKISNDHVSPSTPTEEKLVSIWSDVLQLDSSLISVTRSFFELGGHSLNAMLVNARIQEAFDVSIQLASFFQRPTIAELSKNILVARLAHKATQTAEKLTI